MWRRLSSLLSRESSRLFFVAGESFRSWRALFGVETSRRRLPHAYPEGKWLFVTWHLHGSLPPGLYPPPDKDNAGQAFVWMDRYLDTATIGPLFLKQERIARIIEQSMQHCAVQLNYYDLAAYVIMANHVHMLVLPKSDPSRFLGTLKGYTVREANRLLSRTGHPFWQAESYDHWARDDDERLRIHAYIENNPVKAGLAERAGDYRWSSAWKKEEEPRRLGSAALTACATVRFSGLLQWALINRKEH